jgi:hypothetical protein
MHLIFENQKWKGKRTDLFFARSARSLSDWIIYGLASWIPENQSERVRGRVIKEVAQHKMDRASGKESKAQRPKLITSTPSISTLRV